MVGPLIAPYGATICGSFHPPACWIAVVGAPRRTISVVMPRRPLWTLTPASPALRARACTICQVGDRCRSVPSHAPTPSCGAKNGTRRRVGRRCADARRCCTNRPWPARCPPTGSSLADAIRHWSAELGHPIEDLTAEDDLTPLPSWTPGAKAIADDGLVAEERVLHPALTMVP